MCWLKVLIGAALTLSAFWPGLIAVRMIQTAGLNGILRQSNARAHDTLFVIGLPWGFTDSQIPFVVGALAMTAGLFPLNQVFGGAAGCGAAGAGGEEGGAAGAFAVSAAACRWVSTRLAISSAWRMNRAMRWA